MKKNKRLINFGFIISLIIFILLIIDLGLGKLSPWYVQPILVFTLLIVFIPTIIMEYSRISKEYKFWKLAKKELISTIIKICSNCNEKNNFKKFISCKQLICQKCDLSHTNKCEEIKNKYYSKKKDLSKRPN